MGEVWLALAHGVAGFKKLVVIKQVTGESSREPECVGLFLDEARLAARLNHPNVIQTYEVGQHGGRHFIAMEYLDGQSLHCIQARGGARFSLPMQIRVLVEALAGLHHAHELADFDGTPLGVVHRDVTPHNVFVTYDGQIKLVDFGIAKAGSSMTATRPGTVRGKVRYMAPECVRGEPIDRRTDIFAAGVMLWEMIACTRMWSGLPDARIVRRLAAGKVPALEGAAPESDPELQRICRRALAPNPEDRYATAADLQHDLECWLRRQNEDVPPRAVGAFVAAHFEEERSRAKRMLEAWFSSATVRQLRSEEACARDLERTTAVGRSTSERPTVMSTGSAATVVAARRGAAVHEGCPLQGPATMRSARSPASVVASSERDSRLAAEPAQDVEQRTLVDGKTAACVKPRRPECARSY